MNTSEPPLAFLDTPEQVGPYRILRVLGEGGMGIVYEAEELGPVRRRVALKLIRPGFSSRGVIARFEAERQALAVMNHPAIAGVLNAGTTEDGQPYFAMELVKGIPITEYCNQRRLSTRERLLLFLEVCRGVQHAHQKGVIHRDLKPPNVLVIEQDGRPQPKIIDFGIAKALGQQLTERTLVTAAGHTVGTAAYMSPEQAQASELDVDTRTDIYSLGVMLYELLVGELPLDPSAFGIHAFMARLAAGQTTAAPPSMRLRAQRRESLSAAYDHGSDMQQLRREISGDLDWIVLKAIEPDRSRRYETANGLAMDIQRYLTREPILARPPSTLYRARKFVERNRTPVLAAALAAAALLLGAASTTVGMIRATRAERVAEEEAAAAQNVTDFLVQLFEVPEEGRGDQITARELLDRGVEQVREGLAGQPLSQGRLMHTMGRAYAGLGEYDPARSLLEDALSIRERHSGPHDPAVAETLDELGSVARERGDLAEAERRHLRALQIRERLAARDPAGLSKSLSGLGAVRVRQGRYAEAESLFVRAAEVDASPGADDVVRARNLNNLAAVYFYQGRPAEAEPLFRRVLRIEERALGSDHPRLGATLSNLGATYFALGRYAEALPLYEHARRIYEQAFGPAHPDLAIILSNLAEAHWKLGRYREAESLFRRSLFITEGVVAETPPVASALNGLAGVLRDQRRYAEAEPLYLRALSIRERGGHSEKLQETLTDYAQLLRSTGRGREAAELEARAAAGAQGNEN